MVFGMEELHLVAMYSRDHDKQYPCFWGFNVAMGLYNSCLVMLNLRCLGIVFDLDETLVVANTMRSFEDKIEALQRKISSEVDPQRTAGMLAEVERYQDDKLILKQYAENDQVIENGKVIKCQSEVVPALSDNHQPFVRPLIRLHEKNIILTRINPQVTMFNPALALIVSEYCVVTTKQYSSLVFLIDCSYVHSYCAFFLVSLCWMFVLYVFTIHLFCLWIFGCND